MRIIALSTLLLAAVLLCAGCTEELEPEPQATTPPAQESGSEGITDYGRRGGSSALGHAKESARSTVDQLEQRSGEIAEDLEEPD